MVDVNTDYIKDVNDILTELHERKKTLTYEEVEKFYKKFDEKIKPQVLQLYEKYIPDEEKSEEKKKKFIDFFATYTFLYGKRKYDEKKDKKIIDMAILYAELYISG